MQRVSSNCQWIVCACSTVYYKKEAQSYTCTNWRTLFNLDRIDDDLDSKISCSVAVPAVSERSPTNVDSRDRVRHSNHSDWYNHHHNTATTTRTSMWISKLRWSPSIYSKQHSTKARPNLPQRKHSLQPYQSELHICKLMRNPLMHQC